MNRGSVAVLAAAILGLLAAGAGALFGGGTARAGVDWCNPQRDPNQPNQAYVIRTYEASASRAEYLDGMTLAGYNELFRGDATFGVPDLETGGRGVRTTTSPYVPPVLIKAVSWIESSTAHAYWNGSDPNDPNNVDWNEIGPVKLSDDCGYGLMQITTDMYRSGSTPTDVQALTGAHYLYNIGRGSNYLGVKWNYAPNYIPLVATQLPNGARDWANPRTPEHWYFALWAYNGFVDKNHPKTKDPVRPEYRCDGTQPPSNYPYQELVYGCATYPPVASAKWPAVRVTRPLDAQIKADIVSRFSGGKMTSNDDIVLQAADLGPGDRIASPGSARRSQLLGAPQLRSNRTSIFFQKLGQENPGPVQVTLSNPGSGVAAWKVTPSASWIQVSPEAGVAAGSGVVIKSGTSPNGTLTVSVNPAGLSPGRYQGTVTVQRLPAGETITISVTLQVGLSTHAPGTAR